MKARGGFTMVELLVSLVLLGIGVVGLQMATGRMLRAVTDVDVQTLAAQIAEDRIERIRSDPSYESLSARYAEPATALPDHPGLTRETVVSRQQTDSGERTIDYTRITVIVDGTGLSRPVARTTAVGRP